MQEGDLTYRINGCAMTVHNKLGIGFREYIYCRALAIELRRIGIKFEREVWLPIFYDGYKIGARRVDFLCENSVTIEAKAKSELNDIDFSQALNTLNRVNIPSGLLINFGSKKLEHKHLFNKEYKPDFIPKEITPEMVGEENDEIWEARQYVPDWLVEKMLRDREKKKGK
jgi:GxxExxY protein